MSEAERILLEARAKALEFEAAEIRARLGDAAPSPAPASQPPARTKRRPAPTRPPMPTEEQRAAVSDVAKKQVREFLDRQTSGLVRR